MTSVGTSPKPKIFNPRLVICLHGIRTPARWQKVAANVLSQNGIKHYLYDFGWYGAHKFLFNHINEQMVDEFYDAYFRCVQTYRAIDLSNYLKRPSVIAHSFGTYIAAYCLLKHEDVKIDKFILCGSILPTDFDWGTLFARDQIGMVRNEFGAQDFWAGIVDRFVKDTGPSGRNGFDISSGLVEQKSFERFKHSDYFHSAHMHAHWIPFLQKQPISFSIRHGRELQRSHWESTLRDIRAKVDAPSYDQLQNQEETKLPWGLSLSWVEQEPDIYTILMDRQDEIVGCINAMPLQKEAFEKIKTGSLLDNELGRDVVEHYVSGSPLRIYVMSIATSPKIRNLNEGLFSIGIEKLLNAFIDKLIYYAENIGERVQEIVAVPWTNEGLRLCRIFGMKKIGADRFGNPIFYLSLEEPDRISTKRLFPGMRRLLRVYGRRPT